MDSNSFKTDTGYGRRTRPPLDHERNYRVPVRKAPPLRPIHAVPPSHEPQAPPVEQVHQPAPATFQPAVMETPVAPAEQAVDPTVSIRITVPQFSGAELKKLLAWRPTAKQVLITAGILLIFYVGYHMGWRAAKQPPPLTPAFSQGRAEPWI